MNPIQKIKCLYWQNKLKKFCKKVGYSHVHCTPSSGDVSPDELIKALYESLKDFHDNPDKYPEVDLDDIL